MEIACTQFQGSRFRIDGEINENIRYRFTKIIVAQYTVGFTLTVVNDFC